MYEGTGGILRMDIVGEEDTGGNTAGGLQLNLYSANCLLITATTSSLALQSLTIPYFCL
jgi:hypothetical protein